MAALTPPASVAEEAAKLLAALQAWAGTAGGTAGSHPPPSGDAPECQVCPVCQVLRAVRGEGDGGTRLIDPSSLSLEQLMAISSPLSLADRIAEANLAMLRREGPDAIEVLLASMRP